MGLINKLFGKSKDSNEEVKKEEAPIPNSEKDLSGYVYIISNIGSFGPNIFKIGATKKKNPQDRVDELGDASVPFKFGVHAFIYSKDVYELESQIHRFLRDKEVNKINHKKEFFETSLSEIKDIVKKLGYSPKWDDNAIDANFLKSKEISNNGSI